MFLYIEIPKLDNKFIRFIPFKNAQFIEVDETNSISESMNEAITRIS